MRSVLSKLQLLIDHYESKGHSLRIGQIICSTLDSDIRNRNMMESVYDYLYLVGDRAFEVELDKLINKVIGKESNVQIRNNGEESLPP